MNITVTINNNKHTFLKGVRLSDSIQQLNLKAQGVAVAINNQVIEKSLWKKTVLNDNDTILIITATQGG